MKSIIGLFNYAASAAPAVAQLKANGIPDEDIQLLSDSTTINKLLGCDSGCLIRNFTLGGAAIGLGIYGIFGLIAAVCECNVMNFTREIGLYALLGALLAGTFVGGLLGVLVGVGEAEKDTHLYVQGINFGGEVITVQVNDEKITTVQEILAVFNTTGVKVLQPKGG